MSNDAQNKPEPEPEPKEPPPELDFIRRFPPKPQILYPVCPYCGTDPAVVATVPIQLGPLTMLVVFCAKAACRKILSVLPLGVQEPKIVPPGLSWKN